MAAYAAMYLSHLTLAEALSLAHHCLLGPHDTATRAALADVARLSAQLAADVEAGRPVALATVIEHPDPAWLGRRLVVQINLVKGIFDRQ